MMELCNSIMASIHGCNAQPKVDAFLSWGRGLKYLGRVGCQNSQHILIHNLGSKPTIEVRTSAKEAPEHDLADGRGPGAVGAHWV